jgi:formamidopyrimidine-DNA glycosylase
MPELPEVETTRRGLSPLINEAVITAVNVRETRLRWPFEPAWALQIQGQVISGITRRAKYLIISLQSGSLIVHLGMSGNLRCVTPGTPLKKHDHLEFTLSNGLNMRYHDPRRFGCVLYTTEHPGGHALLKELGPEPLSDDFSGDLLFETSRQHRVAVKNFIMNQQIVVGVGNIYANEALFKSGILPARQAGRISRQRYNRLAENIKATLGDAITCGGTTLRDFVGGDGQPGYFQQTLLVYGRAGLACPACNHTLLSLFIGQRNSVYCPHCQT